MATLWIREYAATGSAGTSPSAGAGKVQVAQEPGTDQTALTYTTSAASAAFGATTRYIGIISDGAFHYVVAAAPTATTNALMVPADTMLFVGVEPGQKIAAIAAA
jgi:hypothetical protein